MGDALRPNTGLTPIGCGALGITLLLGHIQATQTRPFTCLCSSRFVLLSTKNVVDTLRYRPRFSCRPPCKVWKALSAVAFAEK